MYKQRQKQREIGTKEETEADRKEIERDKEMERKI